jgi:hypothetical protein
MERKMPNKIIHLSATRNSNFWKNIHENAPIPVISNGILSNLFFQSLKPIIPSGVTRPL